MKIYVGSDHAGFGLKGQLVPYLASLGHEAIDLGAHEYDEEDDYPEFIALVAKEVSLRPNDVKGIVLGGSGQGEAMVANKFRHVRASVYYGAAHSLVEGAESIVAVSRQHNDANVLSLGARFITEEEMKAVVKEWLETPFSEDERHKRRLLKMDRIHE